MMVGWILRLFLIWLVLRAVIRLVRGVAEGLSGTPAPPPAVALVRDPVCGTFVAPATAPSLGTGAQMRFFCSENCRRIYQMKFAQ
jgi:YHS domain-containing protein